MYILWKHLWKEEKNKLKNELKRSLCLIGDHVQIASDIISTGCSQNLSDYVARGISYTDGVNSHTSTGLRRAERESPHLWGISNTPLRTLPYSTGAAWVHRHAVFKIENVKQLLSTPRTWRPSVTMDLPNLVWSFHHSNHVKFCTLWKENSMCLQCDRSTCTYYVMKARNQLIKIIIKNMYL